MSMMTEEEKLKWAEKRAPGWLVRCTRCGFTEPWGLYGVCLAGWAWKKFTFGRCSKCRKFAFFAIEKKPKNEINHKI